MHFSGPLSLDRNRNTSGFPRGGGGGGGLHARALTHTERGSVAATENHLSGRGNGTGAFWRAQDIRNGSFYGARLFFPSPSPILSFVLNKKCRFNASKRVEKHACTPREKRIRAISSSLLPPPTPSGHSPPPPLLSPCTCAVTSRFYGNPISIFVHYTGMPLLVFF